MIQKAKTLISILFLTVIFQFNLRADIPGECIFECPSAPDYCACIQFYGCQDFDIDGTGEQPCIPVNTHSWVLYLLGASLVVVGYIIHKKSKS